MKAEVIAIGDELLIGQTINTNAAWLGAEMNGMGIDLVRSIVIADEEKAIIDALTAAENTVDLVVITGGLGPTKDDITKHTMCKYFDTSLEVNQEVLDRIKGFFELRGREMLDVNVQQAALPKKAKVLHNLQGSASGMWFERNKTVFISLPGVPYEMKHILSDGGWQEVKKRFKTPEILHRTLLLQGIGESYLAEQIKEWADDLESKGIKLAYLPSPGMVRLRMTAKGIKDAPAIFQVKEKELMSIVPQHIFGSETEQLAEVVGRILIQEKLTISVAESCTGGFLSSELTSISGSSQYVIGGIIAYDNRIKKEVLGVAESTIIEHGAVSGEVVLEMARGVKDKMRTDCAIATSGIAGPNGGTEEKPVGTVWIAVITPDGEWVNKFQFGDHRTRNVQKASATALNLLRNKLLKNNQAI